jgi:hypothetical protein
MSLLIRLGAARLLGKQDPATKTRIAQKKARNSGDETDKVDLEEALENEAVEPT